MTGSEIIHALAIAADGVPVKAVYRHSIHDAGILQNIRLISKHSAYFIFGAAVITLTISTVCPSKRISTCVDGFVVAVGAGNLDNNNPVAAAFCNLYISVRKNIYIDDRMIIDAVPEINNKFFGRGKRHTGKALVCIFYNAKQNITAESIGKSRVCLPNAMGQTALCFFGFYAVAFCIYAIGINLA